MEKEQIAALVRQAQSGDLQAMEQLLRLAHTSVSYQCRKIMAHAEDAEDMTQEVLIRIYNSLGSLQEPEKFISWANSIAARQCINERKRNPKDLQFAEDEEGHSVLDQLEDLDRQKMPDAVIDNDETARMIAGIIDGLPEAQRICTYLFYYDQLSVKEIASMMGVSENTIKSRLNYARKSIKDGVADCEKKYGVKLYGLSPLPFLLYFLRRAASAGADTATSDAAVKTALAAGGTAGAASAAGTAVTGAAVKAAGVFGGAAVKIAAGVLAGVIAVGGAAAGIVSFVNRDADSGSAVEYDDVRQEDEERGDRGEREDNAPDTETAEDEVPPMPHEPKGAEEPDKKPEQNMPAQQPPEEDVTAEQPQNAVIADYTYRRTTLPDYPDTHERIYVMTPLFDEINAGYHRINDFFAPMHAAFNEFDAHVAAALAGEGAGAGWYQITAFVSYQDEHYVSIRCSADFGTSEDARQNPSCRYYTFDTNTGELLTLEALTGLSTEQLQQMLIEILSRNNSDFSEESPWYPYPEFDFYIDDEGQIIYVTRPDSDGVSRLIPLAIELNEP